MTGDRDELLGMLRVRPDWLLDDDEDDEDYWAVPVSIKKRYYEGGAEVDMPALVDLILSSAWLASVRREAAAEGLEEAAAHWQQQAIDEQAMIGPARVRLDLLWARAATIREQVK